jgi:hypothetical protein
MGRGLREIRRARWGVVCALALTCAWAPAVRASQQDAAADPTASSTAKKPAAKTAPHKHKSASQTSASNGTKSAHTASTGSHSSRKKKSVRTRGQQKIDSDRARSIQEALIREHYLTGEATGTWNQASEDAMRKFQADHGWQSKQVPDSRALIKLGLGPSNDHLLNPESAMVSGPFPPRSESATPTSHTAAPTADPPPAHNQSNSSNPQ